MRFLLFLCGLSILALGWAATQAEAIDRDHGMGFLMGALSLGGGIIIAGLFSLRWYWHGLLGGGVLALLGFGRGVLNLPSLGHYISDRAGTGPMPVLETASTLICLLLLVATFRTLTAERQRRVLEQMEREDAAAEAAEEAARERSAGEKS